MKKKKASVHVLIGLLVLLMAAPPGILAQDTGGQKTFKPEELDALLAPIALYPDDLLAQIFMASTYPLEVVQAARWLKANPNLKGDQLTAALEKQDWDPSVKSMVNFPSVLDMMNEKLDWTQKLGDAVLASEKDAMDSVQRLRKKAYDAGNLKSSKEQVVKVDTAYQAAQPSGAGAPAQPPQPAQQPQQQIIVIEPANPQVVYVPQYNPTVVYGTWAYPAYPPAPVYPYGYTPGAALFSFGMGVAVGAAWGYAWGGCNWGHGDVDVNVWRNQNINNNINRNNYANKVTNGERGQGQWQHNPEHRKGVSYRDQNTAQKYNRGQSPSAGTRDQYRGRTDSGRQDMARGDGGRGQGADRGGGGRAQTLDQRGPAGGADRGGGLQDRGQAGAGDRGGGGRQVSAGPSDRTAFQGASERGSEARDFSNRGNQSLGSSDRRASAGDRGGGFGGGGGGRGGGGGGGGRGGGGGGRR